MRGVRNGACQAALILWMAGGSYGMPPQDKRTPVPSPEAQKEAQKTIRDVFKAEFAAANPKRAVSEKLSLAQKLLDQANQTQDDPATQYTLLVEARDLNLEGGDLESGMKVIDKLGKRFAVQTAALKAGALATLAKSAKMPEELTVYAKAYLGLIDEALAADENETAFKSAEQAVAVAKRAKEAVIQGRAQARMKEISELKSKYDRLMKARETLLSNPQDPLANSLVGRHECFVKDDWTTGLPMLAQCSEASIKALAVNDLAAPTDPTDQLSIADGWWTLAEGEASPARELIRGRAYVWTEKCGAKLTGLSKIKASQRLAVLRVEHLQRGDWVDITDPRLFGRTGKLGDPLELTPEPNHSLLATLRGFPKGEFDGAMMRVHVSKQSFALLVFEAENYSAWIDGRTQVFRVSRKTGPNSWTHFMEKPYEKLDDVLFTVLLMEGAYVVYADGVEMHRIPTTKTTIASFGVINCDATSTFDQIKLRRLHRAD